MAKKPTFISPNTEVVTDDLRIAIVDSYIGTNEVVVRFHTPPWPFPEMEIKHISQITKIPFTEEALL